MEELFWFDYKQDTSQNQQKIGVQKMGLDKLTVWYKSPKSSFD